MLAVKRFLKKFIPAALLIAVIPLFCGCLTTKGGLVGTLQTANETYLASKGVSPEVVKTIRKAAGMPDVRTLPGPERVLPENLMLVYDILDSNNVPVDQAYLEGLHRSTYPRIVPAGTKLPSIFESPAEAADPIAKLADLLKKIDLSNGAQLPVP